MGTRLSPSNHQGHPVLDRGPAPPPPSTAGRSSPVSACEWCKVKSKLLMLDIIITADYNEALWCQAIMIKWNADVNSAELQPDFRVCCSLDDEIVMRDLMKTYICTRCNSKAAVAIRRGSCRLQWWNMLEWIVSRLKHNRWTSISVNFKWRRHFTACAEPLLCGRDFWPAV